MRMRMLPFLAISLFLITPTLPVAAADECTSPGDQSLRQEIAEGIRQGEYAVCMITGHELFPYPECPPDPAECIENLPPLEIPDMSGGNCSEYTIRLSCSYYVPGECYPYEPIRVGPVTVAPGGEACYPPIYYCTVWVLVCVL